MAKSRQHESPQSQSPQTDSPRETYSKPRLDRLGRIRDLARMPGGSINAEGASGKPHQQ